MRVAITGGSGFIGALLVKHHLECKDDVRLLTRQETLHIGLVKVYHGDLTQHSGVLNDFVDGVDVLYHCAGEVRHQGLMYAAHVEGTKNLIAAAVGRIGRWVQLSSVKVYGQGVSGVVTETSACKPAEVYGETKLLSEQLVMQAGHEKSLPWIILRPSMVYGLTMTNRTLLQLIEKVSRRQFFFIGKVGAALNHVHVDNVIRALVLCADCQPRFLGNIYNLSDHCPIETFANIISDNLGTARITWRLPEWPIRKLAGLLENIPRFPLTTSRIDTLTDGTVYIATKIHNELDYRPVISKEEGLGEMVKIWKERQ